MTKFWIKDVFETIIYVFFFFEFLVISGAISIYLFAYFNSHRVSNLKGGAIAMDLNISKGSFSLKTTLPEASFYPEDSSKTYTIDIIDKKTNTKIIGFEVDFIPGKYRWACNSPSDLINYQDGRRTHCNEVLMTYFKEKLKDAQKGSKELQAILAVGLASQEGQLASQEILADNRSETLYLALDDYLNSVGSDIPRMRLSFGQYIGKWTDRCDKKTGKQRMIIFIRVYDSKVKITDKNYNDFQKMFYTVYEAAFKENKIPLDGLNYTRFKIGKVFQERN